MSSGKLLDNTWLLAQYFACGVLILMLMGYAIILFRAPKVDYRSLLPLYDGEFEDLAKYLINKESMTQQKEAQNLHAKHDENDNVSSSSTSKNLIGEKGINTKKNLGECEPSLMKATTSPAPAFPSAAYVKKLQALCKKREENSNASSSDTSSAASVKKLQAMCKKREENNKVSSSHTSTSSNSIFYASPESIRNIKLHISEVEHELEILDPKYDIQRIVWEKEVEWLKGEVARMQSKLASPNLHGLVAEIDLDELD